jgi:hypothetical protein
MIKILNKDYERAFIIENAIEVKNLKEIQENKPCRVYFWIDDVPIEQEIIEDFINLFHNQGLNNDRFNNGNVFPIEVIRKDILDLNYNKISIRKPRLGSDGGVIR